MKTPEKITNVLNSQLSIARFWGGCEYNGKSYIYTPEDNGTLTREDIFAREQKENKDKKKGGDK